MTTVTNHATVAPAAGPDGPAADRVRVIPVRHGERPVGAYLVDRDTARFEPAVDVTRIAVTALTAAAATTVAVAGLARLRRPPAIGTVTMGPGGWISLKRTQPPPLRSDRSHRPWWARLLRAYPLVERR
ncbi:hypothetical protein [Polymorphospora rubra]|uniref:hypothetical protein n=1 Tax=Polymorphospora rubra TaxID=338584 RepID=UPI0033E71C6E